MTPGARERVLLVHGLWMRGMAMWPLALRLRRAGFDVEVIDYPSILRGPEPCIQRVVARLRALSGTRVHLVGHSLGGVIAIRAALALGDGYRGRIVCLGSPLSGSSTARRLIETPGPRRLLLGRSAARLARGVEALPARCEVAVVAGSVPIGLGRLFHRWQESNDGTVTLAETRFEGLASHRVVASSHTGLVVSREVAALVVEFLRAGAAAPA